MSAKLRTIAHARQAMPETVSRHLLPLERTAHDTAVQASAFATLLLTSHAEAALPHSAGLRAIRLASEAAQLASESRARLAEAHDELRAIMSSHFALSGPECPPNHGALSPLRSVA